MATIRLFDTMPYARKAGAKVISCREVEHNKVICFECILEQTIFFPEEGGQSPDGGTISGIEVVDVQVKEGEILHYIKDRVDEGSQVDLSIDWDHRFRNMQMHSGEHIFSGTVNSLFGFDNVGFHLSDTTATMDFNGVLTLEELNRVEQLVNQAIFANVEIKAEYKNDQQLKELNYRSKKELEGPVRIVTIEGYDVCACCAPHVKTTGEIGIFKITHVINYKGGVRVDYLCGFRALEYYRESLNLIDSLTKLLTTGRENVANHVQKLKDENYELSAKLLSAKQELLSLKLKDIPENQKDVIIFEGKTDNTVMRNAVNAMVEKHPGMIAFFAGSDQEGYNYILASKNDDMRNIQKKLAEQLAAKGGGKAEMVCGSLKACEEDIENVLKQ